MTEPIIIQGVDSVPVGAPGYPHVEGSRSSDKSDDSRGQGQASAPPAPPALSLGEDVEPAAVEPVAEPAAEPAAAEPAAVEPAAVEPAAVEPAVEPSP